MLTVETLQRIMPTLPASEAAEYLPAIVAAMHEASIEEPRAVAMFLAQLGHESLDLRHWLELASGAAYEHRKDLGNVQPGDGPRYKGRGPIQLTGRSNYRQAGQVLGLPLEEHPEWAARADVGFRVAAWFWRSRGLTPIAARGDLGEVTRKINGGQNGLEDRRRRYLTACAALGCTPGDGAAATSAAGGAA